MSFLFTFIFLNDLIIERKHDIKRVNNLLNVLQELRDDYFDKKITDSDVTQFLKNEQAVLDDVAKYMKQWGLTPNRDTVKLHQELSSTSCPRRSVEVHGGTLESCREYFITELNKRLTGQTSGNDSNKGKGKKKMILFNTVDTKRAYVSDGVTIRWIKTARLLKTFQKAADVTDVVYQKELDDEFGKANTSK